MLKFTINILDLSVPSFLLKFTHVNYSGGSSPQLICLICSLIVREKLHLLNLLYWASITESNSCLKIPFAGGVSPFPGTDSTPVAVKC